MLNIKWTKQVTWFLFNSFNLLMRYKIGLGQKLFFNIKGWQGVACFAVLGRRKLSFRKTILPSRFMPPYSISMKIPGSQLQS